MVQVWRSVLTFTKNVQKFDWNLQNFNWNFQNCTSRKCVDKKTWTCCTATLTVWHVTMGTRCTLEECFLICVHCRSDNSTGGRHSGVIGALPEGCTTQPKQCNQRQTSCQITVRRGEEWREGRGEGGSRAGRKDCIMGPDLKVIDTQSGLGKGVFI